MSAMIRPPEPVEELFFEVGYSQLNKKDEELCGDSVAVAESEESLIVVCSDGLGSGVKASILASLTSKMASTMLQQGCTLEEVIETLAHTLPVCEVRGLAYSTFTILQVMRDGKAYLAEYDNPATYYGNRGRLLDIPRRARVIGERVIREAYLQLVPGDWVCLISDGVLHAGIGGIWNLGWGAERVGSFLRHVAGKNEDAVSTAAELTALVNKLYGGRPGDDASVVFLRARRPSRLSMLFGPPRDPQSDREVVRRLLASPGKRVVCGGTTANIVARELKQELRVDLSSMDAKVPPTAFIDGIDLVSEGMLTVSYAIDKIRSNTRPHDLAYKHDGASRLAALLLGSDRIEIMVGRALNPAHQSPEVPLTLGLKNKVVEDLVRALEQRGKIVTVDYY
ncbi:MAG: SpoIIE family protein phosphatase [Bacillota bacterium]